MKPERLDALFEAWSESRLTPSEATELSAQLRADPEARARFREAAAFHGHLHAALDGLNLDQANCIIHNFGDIGILALRLTAFHKTADALNNGAGAVCLLGCFLKRGKQIF